MRIQAACPPAACVADVNSRRTCPAASPRHRPGLCAAQSSTGDGQSGTVDQYSAAAGRRRLLQQQNLSQCWTQFYAVYPARCSPCQLPHTTQPFSKRAAALQDALGLHSHVLAPCPVLHRHIMWASCAACIQALTQRASAAPTAVHRRSWACPAVDANMHVWGHAFAQQRRARAEQACFKAGSRAVRFCCFPALLFANLLFFCLARGGCARHLLCAQGSGRSPLRFHTS